ncbi:hypothetical protein [Glutamicibacter sp.]|uniref:hypothetical protein n=1 Tax=Glutamicibacter sp. TaxID=1931995 RepID=UPI002B472F33|nr:hypothetical protein [Glutamicibacter sp.]HJX79115.1 hypothetical protein [Glutamicibacter sp.]
MTTQTLIAQLRVFIADPNAYRPGVVRQIMSPRTRVEATNVAQGSDLLEALLATLESMEERGATREEILSAGRNNFETPGAESADLLPYLGGLLWLQSEENPADFYSIDVAEALAEIMLYLDDMSDDVN